MDNIECGILIQLSLIVHQSQLLLHGGLAAYGITPQQARIVGFVGTEQEQGNMVCQKDIENVFKLKGSSITSLLQGLERKGFILRRPDPSNESRKIVTLLPKGQALKNEVETAFRETNEKLVQGLTVEQQQTFLHILTHMAHNIA